MNIRSIGETEINITLGDNDNDVCNVRTSSDTEITCRPPDKPSGTTLALRVRVGRNLVFLPNGITGPEWTLVYTSTSTGSTSIGTIVGGSIAASVIITVLIVVIPLIIVIIISRKRPKDKTEKPIVHEGNAVVPMSTNMIYQGNTSQDNILLHQSNPAYIKASDIHIYDEIPAGQYEEISAVKETNMHNNDDDTNQRNQDDQDNGSYVSQVNQDDQVNGSYVSQVNQDDQDNED